MQRQSLASFAFAVMCVMIYISGNGYVSSAMMDRLEWPEQAMPDEAVQAAVVLGGGMSATPDGTPELSRDGERIFSAAQLYHAGKVGAIICTGMSSDGVHNPSDDGRDALISAGVPSDVIFRIKGENTSQEMKSLRQFLDSPPAGFPPPGPILLVTSAFHMDRAMRLAASQDVEMLPFPCAFRGSVDRGFSPSRWIPGPDAMQNFGSALKEWLASLVGR
ncbi:YdcF family protein [Rubripirellula lacrimiformis]|nr:YdcF family protein [Rubripirellula lacrimiformis]